MRYRKQCWGCLTDLGKGNRMNFIFISPNFPHTYWQFCDRLKKKGVNVLGIGDCPYDFLEPELKASLTEYYRVGSMEDYDSMYRAKEVFGAKKIIIISNTYHLYRALYIAESLGLEAYGVGADDTYSGKEYREFREILARDKDFLKCIFKPEPTFLGDPIDIHGDGDVTND